MSVFESTDRSPVEYLPTGDRALLVAWATLPTTVGDVTVVGLYAVLCLENGTAVSAPLSEIKFDYRYDLANNRWVDVSKFPVAGEGDDGNADQEDAPDGGTTLPSGVPYVVGTGEGDPTTDA